MGVDVTGVNLRRYGPAAAQRLRREHFTELDKIEQATRPTAKALRGEGRQPRMRRVPRCSGNAAAPGRRADPVHRYFQARRVVTPILEEKGLAPFFDFIGGASMDESRDTPRPAWCTMCSASPCAGQAGADGR